MVTHGSEKVNDNNYFSTLLLLVISAWKKVMLEAKEGEYRCNISLDYIILFTSPQFFVAGISANFYICYLKYERKLLCKAGYCTGIFSFPLLSCHSYDTRLKSVPNP